jgi:hypothetical protein
VEAAFLYRPSRPLGILGFLSLAAAVGLMVMPAAYYLAHRSVLEWMIYRFVVGNLAGTSASLLFCASYLSRKIVDMTLTSEAERSPKRTLLARVFSSSWFWLAPLLLFLAGGLLVLPGFLEPVRTGATYEHWSRFHRHVLFVLRCHHSARDPGHGLCLRPDRGPAFLLQVAERRPMTGKASDTQTAPAGLSNLSGEYTQILDQGIRLSGEDQYFFILGRILHVQQQLPPSWPRQGFAGGVA